MESALLIVGVVVSLLIQWLKKTLGTTSLGTLTLLAVVAIAAAAAVNALKAYGFYETVLQVLVTAGAFYAFIIRLYTEGDLKADGLKVIK